MMTSDVPRIIAEMWTTEVFLETHQRSGQVTEVEFRSTAASVQPLARVLISGGFRLGLGGHSPPNLAQPPPKKDFNWFQGCIGDIRRISTAGVF